MITVETLTAALYTFAGLSALIVVITQFFKNKFNKEDKRWVSHLISFITSFIITGIVLVFGIFLNEGVFAGFDVKNIQCWLIFVATVLGCTGISNGLWSYDFMKQILEWIKLLPKKEWKEYIFETDQNKPTTEHSYEVEHNETTQNSSGSILK